ncbi:phage lytic cycle repressor MrpR family protein [Bacillus mojavensis]
MVVVMTEDKNNSLFNIKLKNAFLDDMVSSGQISEKTADNYSRILQKTFEHEMALEKDLNEFTLDELETVMYDFKANNRNTIESYARIISSYLNWSKNKGYSYTNHLATLKSSDFDKYLTNDEVYISESRLKRYEAMCANYQDSVIMRLLFMGVGGKKMSEIRNLSIGDVDKVNNRLRLVNTLTEDDERNPLEYTERYIDVDDYTIALIEGAYDQEHYWKKNGDMDARENIKPYVDLVRNDYIVRSTTPRADHVNSPVDKFVIYRRMENLADVFGMKKLTPKFIQRSGMIYHVKNLVNAKGGDLSLNDIKIVAHRFNLKSYHNIKGFLTMENIMKTYPENREE